jgi:hypothetical protein
MPPDFIRTVSRAVASLRKRSTGEGGFGLIELMIAMTLILVSLLAIAYTVLNGFQDIALARQRQSATGLANQAMEQARALPLDTLVRGLSNTDLANSVGGGSGADPNIQKGVCAGATEYCLVADGLKEQIPRGDNPNVVPLVPHTQPLTSTKIGPTQYTVRLYVSYYKNNPALNTLRLTALVSWVGTERAGTNHQVDVQSLAAEPPGCLSTRTHPFAAPCQPFLYAASSNGGGHVDVAGQLGGKTVDHVSLFLPTFLSAMQIEQISAVQGNAGGAGVAAQFVGDTESKGLGGQVSSSSDNDPTQQDPSYQTASLPSSGNSTLQLSDGGSTLTATKFGSGAGSTTSTVSATTSPANYCPNISQVTNLTTGLPCGGSTAQLGGQGAIQLAVSKDGTDLGSAFLAQVNAPSCGALTPCPNRAVTYRFLTPNGTMCPGAATDGCVHGDASRMLGQIRLGGLPTNVPGPGAWQGYLIQLGSFNDTASAESGIGTAAGSIVAPVSGTGTVSFWNGTGYTTCTVYGSGCPTSGSNYPVATLTRNVNVDGTAVSVRISAAITAGGTSVSASPTCSGTCTRNQVTATSGSPLLGTMTYAVTVGGVSMCNLSMTVDLGTLLVNTSYKAAPTS